MQVVKPWSSGNGSVTLTFSGQGDGTVTVASDDNNLSEPRSMTITVRTLDGSITRTVTITQLAMQSGSTPNFILSDGKYLKLGNGDYFNVQENE